MLKKTSIGIQFFGITLIVTSLLQIIKLLDVENYLWLFQPLPEKILLLRYFVSLTLRILGLLCGIGILLRKDFFRKLTLAICAFTILTIYWKHPFLDVVKHTEKVVSTFSKTAGVAELAQPMLVKIIAVTSFIVLNLIDIGFAVLLIYFFTRPTVKQQFSEC